MFSMNYIHLLNKIIIFVLEKEQYKCDLIIVLIHRVNPSGEEKFVYFAVSNIFKNIENVIGYISQLFYPY